MEKKITSVEARGRRLQITHRKAVTIDRRMTQPRFDSGGQFEPRKATV